MTDFLFDGQRTVYIVLAIALVITVLFYGQTRRRAWLVASGIVAGLIALYALLDFFVETELEADRTQIRTRIEEMAHAVGERNLERLFAPISENFRSPQGKDRKATRDFASRMISSGTVREIRVWDLEFEEQPRRANRQAKIRFQFKAVGAGGDLPFGAEGIFEWNATRGWLLTGVHIYDPIRGREALEVPF